MQLRELEKEEQTKPKASRRKLVVKLRAETKQRIEKLRKSTKPKVRSSEKINKVDKLLARLTKKKGKTN